MADTDPKPLITDLTGVAKLADSKLANAVYEDGLKKTATEAGELGAGLTKTVRMAMQPLFTAIQGAAQRVDSWVAEAVKKVPAERRVDAKPGLLNAAIAAIGVEEDDSALRGNYIRLLASLMDADRQNDLHPAFPRLVQELSPRDAMLLQITPSGNGIVLPDHVAGPNVRVVGGLIQVLENWTEGGERFQRQRFFVKIVQGEPSMGFRVLTRDQTAEEDAREHLGFLEFLPPSSMMFAADEVQWSNLERLRLVHHEERPDPDILLGFKGEFFEWQQTTHSHLWKLLTPHGEESAIFQITRRGELGIVFARCCVPDYAGDLRWHPMPR
jgi:hypothetical protein